MQESGGNVCDTDYWFKLFDPRVLAPPWFAGNPRKYRKKCGRCRCVGGVDNGGGSFYWIPDKNGHYFSPIKAIEGAGANSAARRLVILSNLWAIAVLNATTIAGVASTVCMETAYHDGAGQ